MRNQIEITIPATGYGRDAGKKFHLTEMSGSKGESWAIRALQAMSVSGTDINMDMLSGGWGVLAFIGMRALLSAPPDRVMPLLDEMWSCVEAVAPNGNKRPMIEEDTEEIQTRMHIRDEVFKLHAGFSIAEVMMASASEFLTKQDETLNSNDTDPSPDQSELSSPPT